MNKKVIGIILVVVVLLIGGFMIFKFNSKSSVNKGNASVGKKVLVVYYSATGSTEKVAKKIADNLDADIFEIEPKDKYTSGDLNWNDNNSRVTKEHNDESLRNIELINTDVENWDSYDTILIGYPIWWGIAAWPVNNFVKNNDFTGKSVISFCTSASSGLGNSAKLLEDMAKTGNWKGGYRFSSGASDADIKAWTDSLK